MKRTFLLLPLLLGACADPSVPFDPVGHPDYAAIGYEPFWTVAVGRDEIVLARGPGPGEAGNALRRVSFPRTLPRTVGDTRRYESEGPNGVISIEVTPGPCTAGGDRRRYPDRVRVVLGGSILEGCGGRPLGGGVG